MVQRQLDQRVPARKGNCYILDDVSTAGEVCTGLRFNETTLSARIDGATIADVLAMTADRLAALTPEQPHLATTLEWSHRVDLGYISVRARCTHSPEASANPSPRSPPREHRRHRHRTKSPLWVPPAYRETTSRPQQLSHHLLDTGATLVLVEHNLRIIARAGHIIEIGPAPTAATSSSPALLPS